MNKSIFITSMINMLFLTGFSDEANTLKWQDYRSSPFIENERPPTDLDEKRANVKDGIFTFYDLQNEKDKELATRLLGAAGERISFVDRRKHRWYLYKSINDPIENIILYTHPKQSQNGLCQVERYDIEFNEQGFVESVDIQNLFGIEGDIFKKSNFDWGEKSCSSVPYNHAASYFPAPSQYVAKDTARLLITVLHDAAQSQKPNYPVKCTGVSGQECLLSTQEHYKKLRLEDIKKISHLNCTFNSELLNIPKNIADTCVTIEFKHRGQYGTYLSLMTIIGSTYRHNINIYSVQNFEGFVIS